MAVGTSAGLLDERGAQSLFKHRLLARYVMPFAAMTGSTSNRKRVVVFDGYAGKGRFDDGEPASAELLLRVARKSAANVELLMTEKDHVHFEQLESVVDEYSKQGVKAEALQGKVEDYLDTAVGRAGGVPLFLFLDPTGAMLPYQRLQSVLAGPRRAQRPATEVLINFSAELSRRTAGQLHRDSGDGTYTKMNNACGGSWWKDVARGVLETNPGDYEPVAEAIAREYTRRFSEATGMNGVAIPVRERLGLQPVYHLVFLTRSPYGLWVMADAIARARNDWLEAMGPTETEEDGALIPYTVSAKERAAADQEKAQAVVEQNLLKLLRQQHRVKLVDAAPAVFGDVYGMATDTTVKKAVTNLDQAGALVFQKAKNVRDGVIIRSG